MRKRSSYRPKRVIADTMQYVRAGFCPLTDFKEADTTLRIANHLLLEVLMKGSATAADINGLIAVSNMTMALKALGVATEYAAIAMAGADAVESLRNRERKVCTGGELTAIRRMLELHDAQLDTVNLGQHEAAIRLAKAKAKTGV